MSTDEDRQRFQYSTAQAIQFGELILGGDGDELQEALINASKWAAIAYDKAVEHDVPALHAAIGISAAVQGVLTQRLMAPPAVDE